MRLLVYGYLLWGQHQKVSSRLGPSKLRKFPQNYVEFYAKTKTNKKLKQSIEKAQERLSENLQDVSMYEGYRNQILFKKKKTGTVSQSRLSSSQKGDTDNAPELTKHKTQQLSRRGKKKQTSKNQQIFEQQQSSEKKQQSNIEIKSRERPSRSNIPQRRLRRNQLIVPNVKRSPIKMDESSVIQQQPLQVNRRTLRGSKQIIIESPRSQKQRYNMRSNQKSKQKKKSPEHVPTKLNKQQSEKEQSQKSLQQQLEEKPLLSKGRRGRKSKVIAVKNQSKADERSKIKSPESNIDSNIQDEQQVVKPTRLTRRQKNRRVNPISKPAQSKIIQQQKKPLVQTGTLTQKQAQSIKKALSNRKQLTKLLLQMSITTANIKQILDLGASLALQDGPLTKNIHLLLCTLKATLLLKYFPDNTKHKKKYQKITKQKKKAIFRQSQEEDDQDQQMEAQGQGEAQAEEGDGEDNQQPISEEQTIKRKSKEKQKARSKQKSKDKDKQQKTKQSQHIQHNRRNSLSSNKQNKSENRPSRKRSIANDNDMYNDNDNESKHQKNEKLSEIRAKANQKLQKMIRKAGMSQNVKDYATKIQNTFQQTANAKGDLYRNIAYNRMRNLKTRLAQLADGKVSIKQVKTYLQEIIQSYEAESNAPMTSEP